MKKQQVIHLDLIVPLNKETERIIAALRAAAEQSVKKKGSR